MPTGHKPSYSIISKKKSPAASDTAAHGPTAPDAVPNRGTATARSPFDDKRQVLASEPPTAPTAPADARNSYRPPIASDEEGAIRENGNHLAETQEAGEPPDAFSPVRSGCARLVLPPARIRSLYPTAKGCRGIRGREDALCRCVDHDSASRFFPNDAFPCGCGSIERYRQNATPMRCILCRISPF